MSINVERAGPQDFLPIAEIDRHAWFDNRDSRFIPDGEHVWRIWCEHALVFKIVEDGTILGAILAFPCETGQYCVHKVFVKRQARHRGFGTLLFASLLEVLDAKRAESFLTVDPANKNAISLYEKWGYRIAREVKGFYRPEEDRYLMIRPPSYGST